MASSLIVDRVFNIYQNTSLSVSVTSFVIISLKFVAGSSLVSFTASMSVLLSVRRSSISSLCFNKETTLSEQINKLFFLSIDLLR